jgi:hypothetical protein
MMYTVYETVPSHVKTGFRSRVPNLEPGLVKASNVSAA